MIVVVDIVLAATLGLLIRVGIVLSLIRLFHVGSVLLRYLVLHLVDRVLLQLFADLLLLALPLVFDPVGTVPFILA